MLGCCRGQSPILAEGSGRSPADLRRVVRRSATVEKYHVIIIDTQGAAGELQKTAAIAADVILSPIKPDVLSAAEFADGMLCMMESLNSLSDFGTDFRSGDLYVVISALERNNNARQVADLIRRSFFGHRQVKGILETVVPQSRRLYRCDHGQDPRSPIRPSQGRQVALGCHALSRVGALPSAERHLRRDGDLLCHELKAAHLSLSLIAQNDPIGDVVADRGVYG